MGKLPILSQKLRPASWAIDLHIEFKAGYFSPCIFLPVFFSLIFSLCPILLEFLVMLLYSTVLYVVSLYKGSYKRSYMLENGRRDDSDE